jgi:hypothetical protein
MTGWRSRSCIKNYVQGLVGKNTMLGKKAKNWKITLNYSLRTKMCTAFKYFKIQIDVTYICE